MKISVSINGAVSHLDGVNTIHYFPMNNHELALYCAEGCWKASQVQVTALWVQNPKLLDLIREPVKGEA